MLNWYTCTQNWFCKSNGPKWRLTDTYSNLLPWNSNLVKKNTTFLDGMDFSKHLLDHFSKTCKSWSDCLRHACWSVLSLSEACWSVLRTAYNLHINNKIYFIINMYQIVEARRITRDKWQKKTAVYLYTLTRIRNISDEVGNTSTIEVQLHTYQTQGIRPIIKARITMKKCSQGVTWKIAARYYMSGLTEDTTCIGIIASFDRLRIMVMHIKSVWIKVRKIPKVSENKHIISISRGLCRIRLISLYGLRAYETEGHCKS